VEQLLDPRASGVALAVVPPSGKHAASWPAIVAGAFVAIAVTLILLAVGSGIGFASVSPWPGHGASVTTFAITTAIWLVVTQWISAAMGGYIAGRLRTRWIGTHAHEIFFRDTAHGLITWAVATVVVAVVAAGAVSSTADVAQTAMPAVSAQGSPYGIDRMFRPARTASGANSTMPVATFVTDPRLEAAHIAGNAMVSGSVPEADRSYLVEQVVSRTGASAAEAQTRVDAFINSTLQTQSKIKADADSARKAAAEASIYLALSLLIGAFIASVSAALGGRLRDEHP
jgi:hypothetical protein